MLANKVEVSYILILREAFFAVLDVRFAIDELLGGFHRVLLVCNLSAEKVAGLRWVREGIGRIDLSSESLIKRSHNIGPVQTKQLRACHGFVSFFLGSGRCLCASRRSDGRQPLFTSWMEQKRLDTEPGKQASTGRWDPTARKDRPTNNWILRSDILLVLSRRTADRWAGDVNSCSHLYSQHVVYPLQFCRCLLTAEIAGRRAEFRIR